MYPEKLSFIIEGEKPSMIKKKKPKEINDHSTSAAEDKEILPTHRRGR
jgi:hypothetical protein